MAAFRFGGLAVRIFPTTSRSLCHYFKHSQFPRLFSSIKVDSGLRNPEISQDLTLSESCVKQLHQIFANDKNSFLRVAVEGGGCSGFKYSFDVDSEINEDDRVIERDGAKVVIDEVSLGYLKGSTVEYHEELIRSAFRISFNPNAEKGCSCGSSFTLKL
ncbi:iron-sulfur cluster assembly 2 homolog, mitochondrial-like isoform X1 [Acropora millepora]|uniref:iron-sulfur cluster assembly 2 homolog, mitochondrial-like isoform X1 n=1 Tax=Acropora millepora TaxID=45264 RepID=UPI001CF20F93|nr:iron-sulfur cluster assembly 2 homolog, mitochondrial-like isoform X1 [Acropora millepora]